METMRYDPDVAPDAKAWLELDEGERIALVQSYHRKKHVRLPKALLHAAFHAVVETQIALREQPIVDAMERLQREGLDRHDAVHAIGSVLATHVHDIVQGSIGSAEDANRQYFDSVRRLTASNWRED